MDDSRTTELRIIYPVKKRYAWIDYAKCFSIFLVVSYHSPFHLDGYWGNFLCLLRMPAFFLISGFLFDINKFPSFIYFLKHRSIQLLIPYTFFSTIFYVLWLLVGRNMVGGDELDIPLWYPIFEFFYGSPHIVVATYWFICCLFSIQIIYYFLIKYVPQHLILPLTFVFPILHSFSFFDALPWNLSLAFLYIPFYVFANLNKQFIIELSRENIRIVLGTLALGLLAVHFINGEVSIIQSILISASGLLVLPSYILFVKFIARVRINKIAIFIGKNTIIILALQNYIIGVFKMVLPSDFNGCFIVNIIITFTIIFICYFPIKIINKYIPFVIGRGLYFDNILHHKVRSC